MSPAPFSSRWAWSPHDLLVIGARRRSPVGKAFLGSVAQIAHPRERRAGARRQERQVTGAGAHSGSESSAPAASARPTLELLARHVPGARLVAVADPRPEAAAALAGTLGARPFTDAGALISDDEVDAVVVTATSEAHADLVVALRGCRQAGVLREADVAHPGRRRPRAGGRRPGRHDPPGRLQPTVRRRLPSRPRRRGGGCGRRRAADALGDARPRFGQPGRGPALDGLPADPDPRLRRAALAEPGRRAGRGLRDGRRPRRAGFQGRRAPRHRRRGRHLRQRCSRRRRGELLGRLRVRRARRGVRVEGDGHGG